MESNELTQVEKLFNVIGLDSPTMRFLAVFTTVEGLVLFAKPDAFFERDNARPWSLLSGDSNATIFPFWAPGLLFGLAASILV